MKLMSIFILLGLINNGHSVNRESLLKIRTIWNHLTPKVQKQLKELVNSHHKTIIENNIDDVATIFKDVDPKLLALLFHGDEQVALFQEQQDEIKKIKNEWKKLTDEDFTDEQCCNQLFNTIITKTGCRVFSAMSSDDLQAIFEALMEQRILNDTFN